MPPSTSFANSISGSIRDSGINLGTIIFRQAHSALGGRLKLAVSGGAALPKRVADFFNDIGMPLLEGYGLTEAAPVLSVAHPDETAIAGLGRQAALASSRSNSLERAATSASSWCTAPT